MFVSNELGLVSNKDVGSASEEVGDDVVLVLVLDEEADETSYTYIPSSTSLPSGTIVVI